MGTTDDNGIYFYDDTDGAPTPPVLNVGQQSVSDALKRVGYTVVANITARDSLATAFGPSASKPLMVYRTDAPVGMRYEVNQGSGWTVFGAVSGVIVPLGSGQIVGTGTESNVGVGSPLKNSGWTIGSSTVTVPSRSLITVSAALSANTDVVARHLIRVVRRIDATNYETIITSTAYGDRELSVSGQALVEAGANIQVRVYQNSGTSRTYSGKLTITAEPPPMGW